MTWVKLDVRFPTHSKTLDVGPVAEALWLRGLCYAGAHLTDGFIPFGFVRRMNDLDGQAEADRLVSAGLWETTDGGWLIHDYLEYQRSRDDAEDLSIKRAEAGRRGGKQRASKLLEANASKPKQTGEAKPKQIREEEIREEKNDDPLPPTRSSRPTPTFRFKPTYRDTLGDSWGSFRDRFHQLDPDLTEGALLSMLAEVEQDVGTLTEKQIRQGLGLTREAIKRALDDAKNGGKPVKTIRGLTRHLMTERLREAAAT